MTGISLVIIFADTLLQDVVTVLEGIRNKVSPQTKVTYVKGCEIIGNKLNEITKLKQLQKKLIWQ